MVFLGVLNVVRVGILDNICVEFGVGFIREKVVFLKEVVCSVIEWEVKVREGIFFVVKCFKEVKILLVKFECKRFVVEDKVVKLEDCI